MTPNDILLIRPSVSFKSRETQQYSLKKHTWTVHRITKMDKFAPHFHFCKAKMFLASGWLFPWPLTRALLLDPAGGSASDPVIGWRSALAMSPHYYEEVHAYSDLMYDLITRTKSIFYAEVEWGPSAWKNFIFSCRPISGLTNAPSVNSSRTAGCLLRTLVDRQSTPVESLKRHCIVLVCLAQYAHPGSWTVSLLRKQVYFYVLTREISQTFWHFCKYVRS